MRCRCLSAWSRITQHVPRQPCLHIHSHLCKVVIVLAVLIALQFLLTTIFEARQIEPLFTVNFTYSGRRSRWGLISHSRGLLSPSHNSSFNGSMRVSVERTLSPVENISGETKNLSFLHTHENAVRNASSLVLNISLPSDLNPTTSPSLTVPFTGKSLCPPIPPNLNGPIKVLKDSPSLEELEKMFPLLEPGGHYHPEECQARDRVAIIVPYRDRAEHLSTFLLNLHPLLQRQQLDYGMFVIEQGGDGPFNRAMLMNVGFVEALKLYSYDCFIFHDVDLLPEDDRNLYTCPEQPRHMSVAVDVLKYKLPYQAIFGGVSAMTKTQFQKVNGFSNLFWGWGGEDDDMSNRVRHHGYHISRYPANIARYKMLAHRKQHANPKRYEFLNTGRKRFKTDGLSNLQYDRKELNLDCGLLG
ncbi:beta-1,4-N-acetylgalactosaminyltransferase bre-4-like isoform X3 [Zootermopsis nevadensis]|uniref:beta-1,4-N-acetylgalactosaminyltransferase bre-4-like isoform X3 n=1 Tax=Zootermopsis nevadensis TaxID=136037 RepID=UPI000B8E7779|nr:beta-1,4-N-acetylgalactosaminyltransferase bre-4-like isoform X3 [Zootermopsis nevadensis]